MAVRWLYETGTGTNYCVGMTSDDTQEAPPWHDDKTPSLPTAWSAADPALESPAVQDLVPLKRYNIAQNRVYECNAAQTQSWQLREAKHRKNSQIDRKTTRLFSKGLSYDGERFPLDVDDYVNLLTLYENRNNGSVISWPHTVITRTVNATGNMSAYTIANANAMKDLGEAAFARARSIVDGARDLKLQIAAAGTVAAVNAITDNRT